MLKLNFITNDEINALAKKAGRKCGSCALCCYLLEVEEVKSPARCLCPYSAPHLNCLIYKSRPQVCRDFTCKWLIDPSFGEEWKPNVCGLVVHFSEGENMLNKDAPSTLNIHCRQKDDWKKQPYYDKIKEWAIEGLNHNLDGKPRQPHEQIYYKVIIHDQEEQYLLLPDGEIDVTNSYYMMLYNFQRNNWFLNKFESKEKAQKYANQYNKGP